MSTLTDGKEPVAVFTIVITPAELRILADRIEAKQKQAIDGQKIFMPIKDKSPIWIESVVSIPHKNNC